MRPSKSMYATQEEWQAELVKWMNENPSCENGKLFMLFDGDIPAFFNFLFEGNLSEFSEEFFDANNWDEVVSFAKENGYSIFIEDCDEWDSLSIMLDDAEVAQQEDVWYDADGNESESGIYDAGGHMHADRMSEWADDIRDRSRSK